MSIPHTRTDELLGALAAACDRLVHASVGDQATRARQRRFVGQLLGAPFLIVGAAALLLPPVAGIAHTLVAIAAALTAAWLSALLVALSARSAALELLALGSATAIVAGLVAAGGGLASPVLLCAAALPLEAFWLRRNAAALAWGGLAALAVVPLQPLLAALFPGLVGSPSGWHWLVPVAYAGFVVPRVLSWPGISSAGREATADRLEDLIDGVVLRLDTAGEVVDASAQARRLLGVAPELLLANGLVERMHVGDRLVYLCALTDIRHGAGFRRIEARLRTPGAQAGRDGAEYRPFQIELMRAAGEGAPLLAVLRANDEVVALRGELQAAKDSAESIELAKSRFLAAVSHELRTPLNAIIGFSDMLLHEMFGSFRDPRQKEYVGLVGESGRHLLDVVNSILDVSRIEAGAYVAHPEPFGFRDAARMCHSMLGHLAAAKKLAFTVDVAPDIGELHADRRAVQQMLINLVSNAIKFTPEGGKVVVGAKRIGSRLHFWVSDTGIGMSAKDLAEIGRPFRQVHNDYTRRFEGTGLGLSLVKGLVALHNGTMAIESEPGGGTTVTISLPVDGPRRADDTAEIVAMPPAQPLHEEGDGALRKTA